MESFGGRARPYGPCVKPETSAEGLVWLMILALALALALPGVAR